jgi:hypothetical protein
MYRNRFLWHKTSIFLCRDSKLWAHTIDVDTKFAVYPTWLLTSINPRPHARAQHQISSANKGQICRLHAKRVSASYLTELGNCLIEHEMCLQVHTSPWRREARVKLNSMLEKWIVLRASCSPFLTRQWYDLEQRFSNCGPRTTSGPRVLPLWSS